MICPCCGFNPDLKGPVALAARCGFTPKEREIFEFFARHFGAEIVSERVVDWLYQNDPDGGPDNPAAVVSVMVSKIRKKIARHGLTIEAKIGAGAWRKMRWMTDDERAAVK